MAARLKQVVTRHVAKVSEVRQYWRTLERHERRRVLVHSGCVAWLGTSFAHDWHSIGQPDLAFLALSLVCEADTFFRNRQG